MIRAERGLRAEKSGSENLTKIVDEYRELKAFWGIEPSLEKYLGDRVSRHIITESASASS
jgi:tyrosyl-tRNA synthetase